VTECLFFFPFFSFLFFYSFFTLNIAGSNNNPVLIRVTDLSGRLIEQLNTPDQTVQLGDRLQPGIYFIQVSQGNTKQIVKVVKAG